MKSIPILDSIGAPLVASVFLILFYLQWQFPLRRQHFSLLRRLVRNFLLSAPSHAVMRFTMLPIPVTPANWAQTRHIGLLHWFQLPRWATAIAAFLLMDYAYWWWHWANHMVPFFWRFHNVHHTGEQFFAGGINFIAPCGATSLRIRSRSEWRPIAMKKS
jgi:sterol desaturase/sphingolipid hydroxylase (fatty acid hydroxylase superfamily)